MARPASATGSECRRIIRPGSLAIKAEQVARLEHELDAFNEPLPPLKDFILPGGGLMAAACHVARTVARRAERRVWTLGKLESVNSDASRYLNRLSDLLFVIARVLSRHERGSEVLWRHTNDNAGNHNDHEAAIDCDCRTRGSRGPGL
jgi:cob(I)alamin adenosyltransferase